jgi:hypothetical protein
MMALSWCPDFHLPLGRIVITANAARELSESDVRQALARHVRDRSVTNVELHISH